MPTLTTSRLLLRPWQEEDINDLFAYSGSPLVGPMAGWPPHADMHDAEAALWDYIKHPHCFAIVLCDVGCVIGSIKLNPECNRGRYFAKSLSYALSPMHWGHGYMTEAVGAVVTYAFETVGTELLSAFRYAENVRSGRVLTKCGFTCEGVLPHTVMRYDGVPMQLVSYSMDRSEYNRFRQCVR